MPSVVAQLLRGRLKMGCMLTWLKNSCYIRAGLRVLPWPSCGKIAVQVESTGSLPDLIALQLLHSGGWGAVFSPSPCIVQLLCEVGKCSGCSPSQVVVQGVQSMYNCVTRLESGHKKCHLPAQSPAVQDMLLSLEKVQEVSASPVAAVRSVSRSPLLQVLFKLLLFLWISV